MSDFGIKEVGTMDISWEDLGWKTTEYHLLEVVLLLPFIEEP